MKNRGKAKNLKGQQRRPAEVVVQQPAFDPAWVPTGFVAGRLKDELHLLFEEANNHRKLLGAIQKLRSESLVYANLERDLLAILQPPPAPPQVAPAQG